ncbi:MAG: type II and III secretion system protein [Verrucomicrobiota bacterium]
MKNHLKLLTTLLAITGTGILYAQQSDSAPGGTELTGFVQDNLVLDVQDFQEATIRISNKQVLIDGYWEFKDETGQVLEQPIILSQPGGLTDKLLLALRRPGTANVAVLENGEETVYTITVEARFEENNIEKELESAIMKFVGDPGLMVKVLPPQAALVGANLNRAFGEETASEILAPRGETAGNSTGEVTGADDFRPTILLSGQVANDLVAKRAESIARAYTTNVVNFMSVADPLQVRLNVKIIRLTYSNDTNIGVTHTTSVAGTNNNTGGFALGFRSSTPFFETGPNDNLPIFGQLLTGAPEVSTTVNLNGVETEAELLQEPTLTVLNGQPAVVSIGQSVAVPGEVTVDALGNAVQEFERINVGVTLRMTPLAREEETDRPDQEGLIAWDNISQQSSSAGRLGNFSNEQVQTINTISENGTVTMAIQPSVTSIDPGSSANVNAGTFNGAIDTSFIETRVAIPTGESLVLGGLFNNLKNQRLVKIPFLADIPLVGELFKDRDKTDSKSELVFVVTPKVLGINDKDEKADPNARLPRMQEIVYQEGMAAKPTRISSNDVMVRQAMVQEVAFVDDSVELNAPEPDSSESGNTDVEGAELENDPMLQFLPPNFEVGDAPDDSQ